MPQNPNIKFDLSQTIREVTELNQALEGLGSVAQNLFSNLDRLTDRFNSSLRDAQQTAQSVSQTTGQPGGGFQTPRGQQINDQQVARDLQQAERFRQTREAVEAGVAFESGGVYRTKQQTTSGTYVQSLMSVQEYENYKTRQSRVEAARQSQQSQYAAEQYGPFPQQYGPFPQEQPNLGAQQRASTFDPRSLNAVGMSLADIPSAMREQGQQGPQTLQNLTRTIEQLTSTTNKVSDEQATIMRDTARILDSLKQEFQDVSSSFDRAVEKFRETADLDRTDPRRQEAEREMILAAGQRRSVAGQVEQAQQEAQGMLGGGGGGGRGGLANLAARAPMIAAGVGTVAGIATTAYSGYQGALQTLDQATYGATLRAYQAEAGVKQTAFQTTMESADMTDPANVMRYRADLLFPNEDFRFIGTQGMQNALQVSAGMEMQNRQMQLRQRDISTFSGMVNTGLGFLGLGAGGAAAAAGGGLGMAMGGAVAAQGTTQAMSGAQQLTQGFFGNQVTGYLGGLETNPAAQFLGRQARGAAFGRLAQDVTQAERMLSQQSILQTTRSLQQAEMQQRPGTMRALEEAMGLEETERAIAPLVGGDAMTRQEVLNVYAGLGTQTGVAQNAETRRQYDRVRRAMQRVQNFERITVEGQERVREGFGQAVDTRSGFLGATAEEARVAGGSVSAERLSQIRRMQDVYRPSEGRLDQQRRDLELLEQNEQIAERIRRGEGPDTAATTRRDSIFTQLEMSPGEFMARRAQITAAVDTRATQAQTARMIRLGRAGLGGFEQMVEGAAGIAQVAGGRDENLARMEGVLSQAVAAGFDKSQLAQTFAKSTTQLAQQMQVTGVEQVAQRLGVSAGAIATGQPGIGDALSLRLAAQGMAELDAFTGQTQGPMGAFKAMGAMRGGAGFGTGVNVLTGMSLQQMQNARRQVETGNITDPRVADFEAMTRQTIAEREGLTGAALENRTREEVLERLGETATGARRLPREIYRAATGRDLREDVEGLRGTTGDERERRLRALMGFAREAGAASPIGQEGMVAFATDSLVREGVMNEADADRARDLMERQMRRGNAVFRDVGRQSMRRYVDQLMMENAGALNAPITNVEQLQDYFEAGGAELEFGGRRIGKNASGQIVDVRTNKPVSDEQVKSMGVTRMDLARAATFTAGAETDAQRVHVTNFRDLTVSLSGLEQKIRPNVRNRQGNMGAGTAFEER